MHKYRQHPITTVKETTMGEKIAAVLFYLAAVPALGVFLAAHLSK